MAVKEEYKGIVYSLARFGCFSIGFVYALIGTIAILSLLRIGEAAADEDRIVLWLLDFQLGIILIYIIAAGLFAWVIWRFFEAITDPYEFGTDKSGILQRIGVALSSLGYGLMAYSAIEIMNGNGGGDPEAEQQLFIARIFEWPAGRWLIVVAGLITIGAGIVQVKYVYDGAYKKRLDIDRLSSSTRKVIHILAWSGFIARGIILSVLGYFFIKAGVNENPFEVGDTDTAFDFIGGGIIGDSSFFLVALGTIAYGILMVIMVFFYQFEKERDAVKKERKKRGMLSKS